MVIRGSVNSSFLSYGICHLSSWSWCTQATLLGIHTLHIAPSFSFSRALIYTPCWSLIHSQSRFSVSFQSCFSAFKLSLSITCTVHAHQAFKSCPAHSRSRSCRASRFARRLARVSIRSPFPHQVRVTLFNMEKKILSLGEHVLVQLHPSIGALLHIGAPRPVLLFFANI